jgi:hypothetical protein
VFQNRVLRGIFEPERQEVAEDWKKLHIETLTDLYCSPHDIRVTVSSRMRWTGHVARMGRREMHTKIWWGNLKERDRLEVLGED